MTGMSKSLYVMGLLAMLTSGAAADATLPAATKLSSVAWADFCAARLARASRDGQRPVPAFKARVVKGEPDIDYVARLALVADDANVWLNLQVLWYSASRGTAAPDTTWHRAGP